jgi:hypothetical protein
VFYRLRSHKIKLKLSKCPFLNKKVQYLGYVVDNKGVRLILRRYRLYNIWIHLQKPETYGVFWRCYLFSLFSSNICRHSKTFSKPYRKECKIWLDSEKLARIRLTQTITDESPQVGVSRLKLTIHNICRRLTDSHWRSASPRRSKIWKILTRY